MQSTPIDIPTEDAGLSLPLCPLRCEGPPPAPLPPCPVPTPEELSRQQGEQRRRELEERERRLNNNNNNNADNNAAAAGGATHVDANANNNTTNNNGEGGNLAQQLSQTATSWFNSIKQQAEALSISMERAKNEITLSAEENIRQMDHKRNYDRFKQNFPSLVAKGEVLLVDYGCSAVHLHQGEYNVVDGHVQLTRNYLCFCASSDGNKDNLKNFNAFVSQAAGKILSTVDGSNNNNNVEAPQPTRIRQVIPLSSIVSVQLCSVLPTVQKNKLYFLPIPTEEVVPNGITIYAKEEDNNNNNNGYLSFQFTGFDSFTSQAGTVLSDTLKGTPLSRFYCYLDHAWREKVTVPVEGVQYQ